MVNNYQPDVPPSATIFFCVKGKKKRKYLHPSPYIDLKNEGHLLQKAQHRRITFATVQNQNLRMDSINKRQRQRNLKKAST